MFQPDENGIYARVHASAPRRVVGYAILMSLGALLIYMPLVQPPALLWTFVMIGLGLGAFWVGEKLRRSTQAVIELTETEVRDSTGQILAQLSEVRAVERGAFAYKPSNGFTLVLDSKKPRAWAPGLWWRLGRRVGVGGVTSAGEAKFMAEQISLRLPDQV